MDCKIYEFDKILRGKQRKAANESSFLENFNIGSITSYYCIPVFCFKHGRFGVVDSVSELCYVRLDRLACKHVTRSKS